MVDVPWIHFAHANGYPPGAYRSLTQELAAIAPVEHMPFRPLVPGSRPEDLADWHGLADDLIRWLDEKGHEGGVGIGHSLGGVVTLLAAVRRPDLFRAIILLDPVLLPRWVYWMKWLLPQRWWEGRVPLARIARRRRDQWPDQAAARQHLRVKSVYRGMDDPVFDDFIQAAIQPAREGVALTYSKAWEARIYATVTNPWPALRKVRVPTLGIRGAASDTILPAAWRRWQRLQPGARFRQIPQAGHLVPLEQPLAVSREIHAFLSNRLTEL